ncbi:MAG: putative ABC transporter permease subunit [Planctomycetaceae bacterium]
MTPVSGARPAPPDAGGPATALLTADSEARLFLRLRTAVAWHTLRGMLAGARLRMGLVAVLSAMFWASLYGLFAEAFRFLESLHAEVVPLLFNTFFSSLMVMLVFSAGILVYGGLYRSAEARLLLTLPARAESVFAHKFQEALWFACWGFVLLGSPMLVAYGVVNGAGWPYFALVLPFMVAFAVIPAAMGAICCLALVAWMPRLRLHALSAAVAMVCLAAVWLGWSFIGRTQADPLSPAWFERAFARLSVTEQKLLPSWWLSSGLIEAASAGRDGGDAATARAEAIRFLALLVAHALFLQLLAGWLARAVYRRGFSELSGEVPARRRRRRGCFDRALAGSGSALGRPLRLLLVKDLQIFRRDVSQWSQFVIFFGLLSLYFLNLRSFHYNAAYASMIGFLNVAVVGLILSTFTTRFVYPMISLEGRRFWILGLLPVHRDQIVWSKFVFSLLGGLVPCSLLVLLSDSMLGLRWPMILQHEFCCAVLCAGLSGIAVGLGARMPDLRESSPAKISSGFGGTLCLVLSSLFIMVVVLLSAVPTHVGLLSRALGQGGDPSRRLLAWVAGPQGNAACLGLVLVTGLVAMLAPLALGLRAFRRLEP